MASNLDVINNFFAAYGQRDEAGIRQALAENVTWFFPGRNPLSGEKSGIPQVVAFFDQMGGMMGSSNVQVEQLIVSANDRYVIECQHISTQRADGHNLDHDWCVLWTFDGGKIVEGRHFSADQYAVDEFFSYLAQV